MTEKPCPKCGGPRERRPGGHLYCSPCAIKKARAWVQAQRSDPEKAEKLRAWRRDYMRRRRAERPDVAAQGRKLNREYKQRERARANERERLRKARVRKDQFVERVEPLVLLERDDGICGICDRDLDPFEFQVDHVIPLAKGGEHSYANTQPVHALCNQRKYDKTF